MNTERKYVGRDWFPQGLRIAGPGMTQLVVDGASKATWYDLNTPIPRRIGRILTALVSAGVVGPPSRVGENRSGEALYVEATVKEGLVLHAFALVPRGVGGGEAVQLFIDRSFGLSAPNGPCSLWAIGAYDSRRDGMGMAGVGATPVEALMQASLHIGEANLEGSEVARASPKAAAWDRISERDAPVWTAHGFLHPSEIPAQVCASCDGEGSIEKDVADPYHGHTTRAVPCLDCSSPDDGHHIDF